jgi:Double zinc ribbon
LIFGRQKIRLVNIVRRNLAEIHMGTICTKCSDSLADGQLFCASCGTRRSEAITTHSGESFCTGCGTLLDPSSKFCAKCGAAATRVADSTGPSKTVLPPTDAPDPVIQRNVAAPQTSRKQSRISGVKLFFAIAGVLFVAALAFGSGLLCLGYQAKKKLEAIQQPYKHDDNTGASGAATDKTNGPPLLPDSAEKKVEAIQQAYKHDDLAGILGAVTGESSKPQPLPDWKPAPPELPTSPASKIPLRKSLRLIDAGSEALRGDYESLFIVDSATDQAVHISASQQFPAGQGLERFLGGASNKTQGPRKIECGRTILRSDMENSTEADGYFCREGTNEKHPGTTAMGLSKHTLNELRTAGHSEITFHEDPLKSLFKSFKKAMASGSDASSDAASTVLVKKMMNFAPGGSGDTTETPAIKCTLQKVGATDLAFPVLVNDQPVELPVMNEGHMYVLDDPENPLVVAVASEHGHGQYIKIYWDAEKHASSQLAEQLEKNGRVKVYDLYFDFRSDVLRPESKKNSQ